jgi:hypothetical protein
MTQLFLKKILDFYKILEESEQFFILFLNLKGNFKNKFTFWKKWSERLNHGFVD